MVGDIFPVLIRCAKEKLFRKNRALPEVQRDLVGYFKRDLSASGPTFNQFRKHNLCAWKITVNVLLVKKKVISGPLLLDAVTFMKLDLQFVV